MSDYPQVCPSAVTPFGWSCTRPHGHDDEHQDDEHGGATWNQNGWLADE